MLSLYNSMVLFQPRAAPVAMGIGTLVGGLAFWMMGPAPFLPIPEYGYYA